MEKLKKSELEKGGNYPVKIVAANEGSTNSSEGTWQDFIDVAVPCLLTINATAKATYSQGGGVNAGIRLYVKLDGNIVASDMSFEGESSTITFFSSASTTVFLKPGRYNLEVDRDDIRTNAGFGLKVNYFAVYAKKYRIVD